MKPQQVVQWEWEVIRGEVEFTLLRPTGSVSPVEGVGVEGEQVEGYERLLEPESGRVGEVRQVGGLVLHCVLSRVFTPHVCTCRGATSVLALSCWPCTG